VTLAGLIDTHCHLDQPHFSADREAVIGRAESAGVERMIVPGTDPESSRQAVALAERHSCIFAGVGVHPNDCAAFGAGDLAGLRRLATHPKVVAIGEIGLDYYWKTVPRDTQILALRAQLDLAAELGLPVILHARQAMPDLLAELARWAPVAAAGRPAGAILGVLHAYSGGLDEAEAAYALGFALSLGGPVTWRRDSPLQALVPLLRLDRLMLETDAPYLTPDPHRGRRNEPAYVGLVAEGVARLDGLEPARLAEVTSATARRTFVLEPRAS
jgi:TatD DNase family protein